MLLVHPLLFHFDPAVFYLGRVGIKLLKTAYNACTPVHASNVVGLFFWFLLNENLHKVYSIHSTV